MNQLKRLDATVLALLLGCGPHSQEDCPPIEHPPTIGSESEAELIENYHATDVLELAEHRVLVLHECDADYKVVFYKRGSSGLDSDGTEFNLLNFEAPFLAGDPSPAVWTRYIPSGEQFYFKVDADGVELVPEQGEWLELSPGPTVQDGGAKRGHP